MSQISHQEEFQINYVDTASSSGVSTPGLPSRKDSMERGERNLTDCLSQVTKFNFNSTVSQVDSMGP